LPDHIIIHSGNARVPIGEGCMTGGVQTGIASRRVSRV
jgi:hypothetical protein